MDMRAVDVLTNLKNWPAYDYKAYKLDKHEADPCINEETSKEGRKAADTGDSIRVDVETRRSVI